MVITPELQKRIDEARQAYREGRCISCRTREEHDSFLDALKLTDMLTKIL